MNTTDRISPPDQSNVTPSTNGKTGFCSEAAEISQAEALVCNTPRYPPPPNQAATPGQPLPLSSESYATEWARNPDGTPLIDHNNNPVSVGKILATKVLRSELSTRPGPGGRKLSYMSGESITRTLNDIFGYDGWCLEIKDKQQGECIKDEKGRYHVSYIATVRLTHRRSGTYKEDCGVGESIDKSLGTATGHALKSSITDAMKRAAKHFGDKLGNSLYQNSSAPAPKNLKDALDAYDIEQKKSKFGFDKDRKSPPLTPATNHTGKVSHPIASGISTSEQQMTSKTTCTAMARPSSVSSTTGMAGRTHSSGANVPHRLNQGMAQASSHLKQHQHGRSAGGENAKKQNQIQTSSSANPMDWKQKNDQHQHAKTNDTCGHGHDENYSDKPPQHSLQATTTSSLMALACFKAGGADSPMMESDVKPPDLVTSAQGDPPLPSYHPLQDMTNHTFQNDPMELPARPKSSRGRGGSTTDDPPVHCGQAMSMPAFAQKRPAPLANSGSENAPKKSTANPYR